MDEPYNSAFAPERVMARDNLAEWARQLVTAWEHTGDDIDKMSNQELRSAIFDFVDRHLEDIWPTT